MLLAVHIQSRAKFAEHPPSCPCNVVEKFRKVPKKLLFLNLFTNSQRNGWQGGGGAWPHTMATQLSLFNMGFSKREDGRIPDLRPCQSATPPASKQSGHRSSGS